MTKSRLLLGTVAFAAVTAFAPLAAHATEATTTTTTQSTVTTNADVSAIPVDEDAMKPDDGMANEGEVTVEDTDGSTTTSTTTTSATPAVDATVGAAVDADSKTVTTHSYVTDTTVTPPAAPPKPIVAPSVKGHKKGDRKDTAVHAATGSDESNTAGDKAAKAITPLKDSSVPAGGKAEVEINLNHTH